MSTKFGFGGLNTNLNSNTNTISTNLGQVTDGLDSLILVGRVIDIVLEIPYKDFKEYKDLGTIEFVDTRVQSATSSPGTSKLYAKPLFSNVKNYPILNEIVYIVILPGLSVMKDKDNSPVYYYFNSINIWNTPHHNAVPFYIETDSQNTQNKDYNITTLGSTNKSTSTATTVPLGPGFKEYGNIHPIQSYLGDYIIEGRWGNSIRLGSTVKSNSNNWSTNGDNGNPITIIRNGQPADASSEGYIPIVENINKDLSSIYLTSNQKIPIKVTSKSYSSYNTAPTDPASYINPQVIVTSERVLINSTKDHILLSSPKSINLNSLDSVNIDSKNSFIVNSRTIKLGNKTTTNPMLKGRETVQALNIICDQLIKVSTALSVLIEILPPVPQVAVNIAASEAIAQISLVKGSLQNLKSKTNFLI